MKKQGNSSVHKCLKMKILITNNEENIAVVKDLEEMDTGLMGQLLMELEIIKQEVLEEYENKSYD